MNTLIAPIIAIVFIARVIYPAFTRKLKQHRDEVFAGLFFTVDWMVILTTVS
jgi:hypothetical protein